VSVAPREARRALEHQGRYAGAVTRLLAYLADITIISVLFGASIALMSAAIDVATPWTLDLSKDNTPVLIVYFVWAALYFGNSWVLRAKSPGMTLLGLRIVRSDGGELDKRHALIRLVAFPLGFLTLGLGFLGIIFGKTHQAIYDRIADTAVVYGWDAESAKLRAIARERQEAATPKVPTGS
jgi:uncharacterized RDD family membrane protein YckC